MNGTNILVDDLMRILITGGCGFIGCNLANSFLQKGAEVIIYDNLSRSGAEKNKKWLEDNHQKNLTFIHGDIRDFRGLKSATKDADTIFHTAAQVAVTTSVKNPKEDFEINVLGTFNVLEAVRLSNTDPILLYTSTNKVYGNNVNKLALLEKEFRYEFADNNLSNGIPEIFSTDANEHTPYGSSKYASDVYVRDYSSVYGLKTVSFRMSCIYGLRQFGNEDQGWVAHFLISSVFNKPIVIYGDGKQVRDVLFISDLINAFNAAVNNINKTKGEVFNMGGGPKNTLSLLELIDFINKARGRKIDVSFDDWRPFDQKVYISDIRKAKEYFGWEPQVDKETGINKILNWITSNIHLFE